MTPSKPPTIPQLLVALNQGNYEALEQLTPCARKIANLSGQEIPFSLPEAGYFSTPLNFNLVQFKEASHALDKVKTQQARPEKSRFLGGLSLEEAAEMQKVSVRKVRAIGVWLRPGCTSK